MAGVFRRVMELRAKLALEEGSLFLLLAVVIGVFAGLAVVCFRIAIEWTRISLLGSLYPKCPRVFIVPAIAGLVIAFLVVKFFPRVRGSGVTQTKSAVYIYDGLYSVSNCNRKIYLLRPRNRQRPIAGAGRSISANGCRYRIAARP